MAFGYTLSKVRYREIPRCDSSIYIRLTNFDTTLVRMDHPCQEARTDLHTPRIAYNALFLEAAKLIGFCSEYSASKKCKHLAHAPGSRPRMRPSGISV